MKLINILVVVILLLTFNPNAQAWDPLDPDLAVIDLAATHIVSQQCDDGGFDWPHNNSCATTYHNLTAPIINGVRRAWEQTNNGTYLSVMIEGGDFDLLSTWPNGEARSSAKGPYFLLTLSQATGNPIYQDFIENSYFAELENGTYGPDDLDTAGEINRIVVGRAGTYVNLLPWEFMTVAYAAQEHGRIAQAVLFEQAILDSLNTMNEDSANHYYDTIGVTGAVWGLSAINRLVFPAINSPNHASLNGISSLQELADFLVNEQNIDGSWNWHSNLPIIPAPDNGDKDTQTTAYAVLALIKANEKLAQDYLPTITAGQTYLESIQLVSGGFPSDGSSTITENTEVEAEAISALAVKVVLFTNATPLFTIGADQSVGENSPTQIVNPWATGISAGAVNESNQTLSFNVSNDNNGLFSIQPAVDTSGILSYTPANNTSGSAIVTISISDNGGTPNGSVDTSVEQTFIITMIATNNTPVITSNAVTSVDEDSFYTYTFIATDVDVANTLTYSSVDVLPSWLSFDSVTGELIGTPINDDVGTYSVTLRVNDGTIDVDQVFNITVVNTNDFPIITSNEVTTAYEDQAYGYTLTATDIDIGDSLSFSVVTSLPSWLNFNTTTGLLLGTPSNDDVGSHNITLRVFDGTVNVDQSFIIEVLNVNDAPSFNTFCDIDATDITGGLSTTIQIPVFIYNILVGPTDELAQTFSLAVATAVGGDPDALINNMSIDSESGDIVIDIDINNSGVATIEVTMTDSGGTDNGGIDSTMVQFNLHHYADLELDPNYSELSLGDILYKNTFDPCR